MKGTKLRCMAVLVAGLVALAQVAAVQGRPYRGAIEAVVVLCEPSDADAVHPDRPPPAQRPRPTVNAVKARLVQRGGESVADFVHDWSLGVADFSQARVFGWYTLPLTLEEWQGLGREGKFDRCVDEARRDPAWVADPPIDPITLVVGHPMVDLFGMPQRRGAFVPQDFDVGNAAHELGHALGLGHAHGFVLSGPSAGQFHEYGDPWDVMAWANNYMINTRHGIGPAGMSAPSMEYLGWLPSTRIVTHGADGRQSATYCLAPLNEPLRAGWLMVRVSRSDADPLETLAIEYRNTAGWGRGIPATIGGQVRILRVERYGFGWRQLLLYELEPVAPQPWLPANEVEVDGVRIRVLAKDPGGCGARVMVEDQRPITPARLDFLRGQLGPNRCLAGFVPRALDPYDHVCTTEALRDMHHREGSPWPPLFPGLVITCPRGEIFRDAFPGDSVCVPPSSREQAAADNRASRNRFETR